MIQKSEKYLIDTNVLIYSLDKTSKYNKISRNIIDQIFDGKRNGVLATQNVLELYASVTSPRFIPHSLTPKQANSEMARLSKSPFEIISPHPETLAITQKLCVQTKITGKKIFDVFLIATMLSNNVSNIVTVNIRDFQPFDKYIKVIHPEQIGKDIIREFKSDQKQSKV